MSESREDELLRLVVNAPDVRTLHVMYRCWRTEFTSELVELAALRRSELES